MSFQLLAISTHCLLTGLDCKNKIEVNREKTMDLTTLGLQPVRVPNPAQIEALYYPHIHFRSRRWLRMAMLYYDNITRIVPSGFEADQPGYYSEFGRDATGLLSDIRELQNSGFIREEAPGNFVSDVANEFFDFAMENLTDPVQRAKLVPALSHRTKFYTIHGAKIDPVLIKVLVDMQLARKNMTDPNNDWDIEPVTGGMYMLFLAGRMAGNRQLVSDSSVYQSLMYKPLESSEERAEQNDREFRLATAVLHTVVPENLEQVSLDVLLRLRSDLSDQRRNFQDRIASLAKDLRSATGLDHIDGLIERQKQAFNDEYEVFKDKLLSANLSLAQALFSLSVPAYITSQWGFGATGRPILFAAGAIAASVTAVRYVLERRTATALSPYTYLLNVGKRIDAGILAEDIVKLNLSDRGYDEDDEDPRVVLQLPPSPRPMGNPSGGTMLV